MNDRMILVVDDEAELLEMVKSIFERAGFTQVLTAASGEAALKMCKEKQPDMVILDVMMLGMDGFATLRELRKTSKVPVLMLTARGEAEDKFAGFEGHTARDGAGVRYVTLGTSAWLSCRVVSTLDCCSGYRPY